jgi:serine/threonine protein kinase
MALELALICWRLCNPTICAAIDHQMELLSLVDVIKLGGEFQLISYSLQNSFRKLLIQTIRLVQTTQNPTKIVRIIVGIVLAMSYVHSQKVIHRDLTPENILLDWKWNVRIVDFGGSTSPEKPWISCIRDGSAQVWPFGDSHYLAPECYDNVVTSHSDVFSFGLILYELIVREPAIPKTTNPHKVGMMLVMEN